MAFQRYYGSNITRLIDQIMLVFVYAGPLCGGYALVYSKDKLKKLICYSTFIPIFVSLLTTNTKAGVIACILLFSSGYIVSYVEKNKKSPTINIRSITIIVILESSL